MSAEEIYNQLAAEEEQSSQDQDGVAEEQEETPAGGGQPTSASEDPDTPHVPETAGGIGQVLDAATDHEGGSSVGGRNSCRGSPVL